MYKFSDFMSIDHKDYIDYKDKEFLIDDSILGSGTIVHPYGSSLCIGYYGKLYNYNNLVSIILYNKEGSSHIPDHEFKNYRLDIRTPSGKVILIYIGEGDGFRYDNTEKLLREIILTME